MAITIEHAHDLDSLQAPVPPSGPSGRRPKRSARWWLPGASLGAVLGYLVVIPIVMLVWSSFKPTGMPMESGFTFDHYRDVYGDAATAGLAWNSAVFAGGSMLVAMVAGVLLAWLTERTDLPGRTAMKFLIIVPMAMPPVLLAIAWVLLLSPDIGALNTLVASVFGSDGLINIYSMPGMIFVQGLSLVPTTYLIVSPAFRNMDPSLEEAALTSGVPPWKAFFKVTLPLLSPALIAAGAFMAILGFVVFDIPGVLGMPVDIYVLSSEIFDRAQPPSGLPDYGGISALAVSFLLLLLALSWFYQRKTKQSQRFVTVTGKAARARQTSLGKWKVPALALAWGYIFVAVALPFTVLLITSLMPYYSGLSSETFSSLTLANHKALFADGAIGEAAVNSIIVAVVAATAVTTLAALISWYVVRSPGPLRRTYDMVAFLPLAVPNVMIGLALIYVYLTINFLPIYGTVAILAIAYTTTYLSFGTRVTNGVLLQFSKDLEEAAQTSGARWSTVFRAITLPMMKPALVGVWVWVAAHALREMSGALMLQGTNNSVVPTLLWGYWESGRPTIAAAAGVWLILAMLILVTIWALVTTRRKGDFR